MRSFCLYAPWLIAAILLSASGSSVAARDDPEVAITVDDLPIHGALPSQTTRVDIAKSMIDTLKVKGVPSVYGFVNASRLKNDPQAADVLKLWVDAGFLLGNHTYAHLDLDQSDVRVFEQDIAANEPVLESYMGARDWHWFRYPFLHEGDTPTKRRAVRKYLRAHGYQVAQVTLGFQDYAWNNPYSRCVAQGDADAIAWLKSSYLSNAAESIALGQKMAYMLFGRNISYVLMLHIGAFDSVMLPSLLDHLTQQGFHFVSLPEAEADPAYQSSPDAPKLRGGTLLEQLIDARHLEYPPHAEAPLAKLSSICR